MVARHACIERNKRCALAYHAERWRRVRALRWQLGCAVLPGDVRAALAPHELHTFRAYNGLLAAFMQSLGAVDVTRDQQPPTTQLNINVLCVAVGEHS